MAQYGDTFFFGDDDDLNGHLHLIITEPTDGKVITVPVTTRRKKSDAMVPLEVGDHPFIHDCILDTKVE